MRIEGAAIGNMRLGQHSIHVSCFDICLVFKGWSRVLCATPEISCSIGGIGGYLAWHCVCSLSCYVLGTGRNKIRPSSYLLREKGKPQKRGMCLLSYHLFKFHVAFFIPVIRFFPYTCCRFDASRGSWSCLFPLTTLEG